MIVSENDTFSIILLIEFNALHNFRIQYPALSEG